MKIHPIKFDQIPKNLINPTWYIYAILYGPYIKALLVSVYFFFLKSIVPKLKFKKKKLVVPRSDQSSQTCLVNLVLAYTSLVPLALI